LILEAAAITTFNALQSTFQPSAWIVQANVTLTSNYAVAPDGSNTAARYQDSATSGDVIYLGMGGPTNTSSTYTASCYAKANGTSEFELRLDMPALYKATFDLSNGTITQQTASGITAHMEDVGNGWYRCSISTTSNDDVTNFVVSGDTDAANDDILIWGAMLEVGSALTSFIYEGTRAADVASSVAYTRQEDVAYIDDIQNSDWYDGADSGATIYAEGRTVFDTGLTDECVFVDFHSGSSTDEIRLYHRASTSTINFINDGGSDVILNSGIHGGNNYHKMAGAMALNDFAFSVDGGTTLSDVSNGPSLDTLTTMGIGGGYTSAITLSGHIKKISYYPERLTNAELVALTENN
jgi:hypothetical protein